MNRLPPEYLKLHLEESPSTLDVPVADLSAGGSSAGAWRLHELPMAAPVAARPRERLLVADANPESRPSSSRRGGAPLQRRLENLLRTAGELTACDAAAAYLLDDATSQLRLCASWGRPGRRQTHPSRPLRGQLADLEALLGQAVVLPRAVDAPEWKIPEECGAAVCVPISAGAPLGTLWTFSPKPRDFTAEQLQMLDVVSGRIAAEVERDDLLHESAMLKAWHRHWRRAVEWQHGQRPQPVPLAQGWQTAVATSRTAPLAGGYHDWSLLPNEQIAVAVGQAQGDAVEAQLTVAALHAGLKSHAPYAKHPGQLLRRLNDTFWVGSAGDQFTALAYAMLHPTSGSLEFAASGPVAGLVVRPQRHTVLHGQLQFLGENPDATFAVGHAQLDPGDMLIMMHPVPGAYAAREAALRDAEPLDRDRLTPLVQAPWVDEFVGSVRALSEVSGPTLSTRLEAAWRQVAKGESSEPTLVMVRRERLTP